MGRYLPAPSTVEFLSEIKTKESELHSQEMEHARVLLLLESVDVSDESRQIFQRYVSGELTLAGLRTAIETYLNRKSLVRI